MHRSLLSLMVIFGVGFNSFSSAQDVDPCSEIGSILNDHGSLVANFLDGESDLDSDGLPDNASLRLVEAVVCINSDSDMADATWNAFNMNLSVFDLEEGIENMVAYRETIAMLMVVSVELQIQLNAALGDVLLGTYEVVRCTGEECTPDPVVEVEASVAVQSLSIVTRAADEPYSGTGNLDGDANTNVVEYNNVQAQNGYTSDFVTAATSPNLTGEETLRTPGGGGGGGCFVATAAYGTPLAQEVEVLREIRDGHLLHGVIGSSFVDGYYRVSPTLADAIATYPVARSVVRTLLYPVVWALQSPVSLIGGAALVLLIGAVRRRAYARG